ncbi:MAG: hypothetical protein U5N86_08400 [Planctomycetota bacterium]|nr:hypothetical protein [Planctomycetota bacterium]
MGGQKGTVLIVVAGIIAALALMGVSFLILTGVRSADSEELRRLEQARQAAVSGLEYGLASIRYIEQNQPDLTVDDEDNALNAQDAITVVNQRLFTNSSPNNFFYLANGNFAHDAFDLSPDSSAILGAIQRFSDTPLLPSEISDAEEALDPVGAIYYATFEQFDDSGVTEPDPPEGETENLGNLPNAYINVYGWGRAFERVGESDFAPVCDSACIARVKLGFSTATVTVPVNGEPNVRIYDFEIEVVSLTERKRIEVGGSEWPAGIDGTTWFLE